VRGRPACLPLRALAGQPSACRLASFCTLV